MLRDLLDLGVIDIFSTILQSKTTTVGKVKANIVMNSIVKSFPNTKTDKAFSEYYG